MHAKQSLWTEFWTDFIAILSGASDVVGLFLSAVSSIVFIIKWTFFVVGRLILRQDMQKPSAHNNLYLSKRKLRDHKK